MDGVGSKQGLERSGPLLRACFRRLFSRCAGSQEAGETGCVCYNRFRFHGGYSSMVERRSVAPDGVGSSPTTHPNKSFIFNRLAYAMVH
jgi:hypothetical protein